MKRLLILCILVSLAGAQTIVRPKEDTDSGNAGCTGTRSTSSSMVYGHDAGGLTTSSTLEISGSTTTSYYRARKFFQFQREHAISGFTALVLKISSASTGAGKLGPGGGASRISYSLDGGSTFSSLRSDSGSGWTQTTDNVTMSLSQDLTKVQVVVCVQGNKGLGYTQHGAQGEEIPPGSDDLTVYDIWINGTTTPQPAGTGSAAGMRKSMVSVN